MLSSKKNVKLSDDHLSDLLKLGKKWFISWSLDAHEILRKMDSFSKKEMVGFSEGTHEMILSPVVKNIGNEEDFFECIFTSDLITIPDIHNLVMDCKKLSNGKLDRIFIPEELKTGIQKRLKIIRLKKIAPMEKTIDRLKQEPGAILSNFIGLRIAEIFFLSQLPEDILIRGVDEKINLPKLEYPVFIPEIIIRDKKASYCFRRWGTGRGVGTCFLVLCD